MASAVLKLPTTPITGVSILDGVIYYTDNVNEVRCIDIEKFKALDHSSGYTQIGDFQFLDGIAAEQERGVRESDITLISKAPTEAPVVISTNSQGINNFVEGGIQFDGDTQDYPWRDRFPRFAYRWRYENNSYSPISPWSEIAFLPLPYLEIQSYTEGINASMLNAATNIRLDNIRTGSVNVRSIQVLYTDTLSSTEYETFEVFPTIEERVIGRLSSTRPELDLHDRRIGGAIDPAQSLRLFDNIPRRAKALDITANRLLLANYVQNHNQPDAITSTLGTVDISTTTVVGVSLKTARLYEMGISLLDKFGRIGGLITLGSVSTPFYTNALLRLSSTITTPVATIPDEFVSYRYWVKDASREHRNVTTVDSYNDEFGGFVLTGETNAGDLLESSDNSSEYIWLAIPSTDRNKITETSVLIPKRTTVNLAGDTENDGGTVFTGVSRHPVSEIENEAPEVVLAQIRASGNFTNDPEMVSDQTNALRSSKTDGVFFVKIKRALSSSSGGGVTNQFLITGQSALARDAATPSDAIQATDYRVTNTNAFNSLDFTYTPPGLPLSRPVTLAPSASLDITSETIPSTSGGGSNSFEIAAGTTYDFIPGLVNDSTELNQTWFEVEPVEADTQGVADLLYFEEGQEFVISKTNSAINEWGEENILRNYVNTITFFDRAGTSTGAFIEETRLEGRFNSTSMNTASGTNRGVRALAKPELFQEEHLPTSITWSGIYNPTTGLNLINQFLPSENIRKDIEPNYGGIQLLHTRDTNVIAFCEDKVFRILADKDALYNADGSSNLTATSGVLGQTVPFIGEYGIGVEPSSFASYGQRLFFSDTNRGVIMQLTPQNGQLFEISTKGTNDLFRDLLSNATKIIGAYDDYDNSYDITVYSPDGNQTLTYNLDTETWVSRRSYIPEGGVSARNNYYTFKAGKMYRHNSETALRNNFYDEQFTSSVTYLMNEGASAVKEFTTIGYEGMAGWEINTVETEIESTDILGLQEKESKFYSAIAKENPIYEIVGTVATIPIGNRLEGDVVNGNYVLRATANNRLDSGVKGVVMTVELTNNSTSDTAELYAVNSNYFISS